MKTLGRYVGRSTCAEKGRFRCEDKSHYHATSMVIEITDEVSEIIYSYQLGEYQHMNVIAHYHVPHLGIITIRAISEQVADQQARIQISEGLSKLYLAETKKLMSLEKLMKETSC